MQICNESLEWLTTRFALRPPRCVRQVWLAPALLFLLAGCSTVTVRSSTQSEHKDWATRTIEWNSYASDFDHLNAPAQVKKFPTTLEEQLAGYRSWRDVEPDPELRPQLDLTNTIKTWVTVCDYQHPFYERCLKRQRYPKWLIAPSGNEIQEAARYFASRFSRTRGPFPQSMTWRQVPGWMFAILDTTDSQKCVIWCYNASSMKRLRIAWTGSALQVTEPARNWAVKSLQRS